MSIEGDIGEHFKELKDSFDCEAADNDGGILLHYSLCNSNIDIHFASEAVEKTIAPAFSTAHAAHSETASFRISVFDHHAQSWPVPIPESLAKRMPQESHERHRHSVPLFRGKRYLMLWNNCQPIAEELLIDFVNREAIVCLRHTGQLPGNSYFSPLRNVLSAWFESMGHLLLHASAVGISSGGVVIAGGNGQGKSTVAASCIGTHLRFAGDDAVFISPSSPHLAHLLYPTCSIWLNEIENFPHLSELPHIQRVGSSKAIFSLHANPHWIINRFPIKAVLITAFTHEKCSSLKAISASTALRRTAPSSLFRNLGDASTNLLRLTQFLSSTPCFCLTIGTSHRDLPGLITELLES